MPFNRSTSDAASAIERRLDDIIAPTAHAVSTIIAAADIQKLTFPLLANNNYTFEFNLHVGCSGVGGVKFAITVPSGAIFRAEALGIGATAGAITSALLSSSGVLSSAFNLVSLQTGWVRIYGAVIVGGTPGTLKLQFASGTAGQTSTIYNTSSFNAVRIW